MQLKVRLAWTEWYLGVWWFPVKKDLAFGICLGPIHIVWARHHIDVDILENVDEVNCNG